MNLREAIENANRELEYARQHGVSDLIREIFLALDPDSAVGNPNRDSVVNELARSLYFSLGEVETRRELTIDVIARHYLAVGIWIGGRAKELMEEKHPNGQEGLRE